MMTSQAPKSAPMLVFAAAALMAIQTPSEGAAPRPVASGVHQTGIIQVKFRDGVLVRPREGKLEDFGTGALTPIARSLDELASQGALWERAYDGVSEAALSDLQRRAARALGKHVADQNLHFRFRVPAGEDCAAALARLRAMAGVEWAEPMDVPPPAPTPPDFSFQQVYRGDAPFGIGAAAANLLAGGAGQNSRIADIEYGWNLQHQDLPTTVTLLGQPAVDPYNDPNHGTAVLGQLFARPNSSGTVGVAYGAQPFIVAANTAQGYDVARAINLAAAALGPGDVILIEQQTFGPNYSSVPAGNQVGLVPSEWRLSVYNAIVTAVGNGIIVVEAAGNGSQNLDLPVYNTGHAPFTAARDSGAIIVGASAAGAQARMRLSNSNYGSTVDLQGLGQNVFTTGYGDAYSAEGVNLRYTAGFGGTSSASPLVAGVAAIVQSVVKAQYGTVLTPLQVRDVLRQTGTPQAGANAASENIGPLPDALLASITALTMVTPAPGAFALTAPVQGQNVGASSVFLDWQTSSGAATYRLIVDDTSSLASPVLDTSNLSAPGYTLGAPVLQPNTTYYWRVEARNVGGSRLASPTTGSFSTSGACLGDANGDRLVNFQDLTLVFQNWGGSGPVGDASGDGRVDMIDLMLVLSHWETACP